MSDPSRAQHFPIGASITLEQQDQNPYPAFAQLLAHEPISWIDQIDMWYVTRREDVLAILANTETYTVVSEHSLMLQAVGTNMLTTDGATHTGLRRPFAHAFAPKLVREPATPITTSIVNGLIDGFIADGTVELKAEFADIVAIQVVASVLGLPIHDVDAMRIWVSDMNRIMSNYQRDPVVEAEGQQAMQAFSDYLRLAIEQRRATPDHSVLSQILNSDDHQLTDQEVIDALRVIIFGGVETTSAMLTNTVWALLQHPDQFEHVRTDPSQLPNAIEESLRWESPVQTTTRHVTHDVQLHGVYLKAGDTLQCMLGAANRDPQTFHAPNQFDITRNNAKDHLAFANGRHFCIGAGLARLEAQVALKILFERLPNLQFATDAPAAPQGYEFRACPSLQLRWEH